MTTSSSRRRLRQPKVPLILFAIVYLAALALVAAPKGILLAGGETAIVQSQ